MSAATSSHEVRTKTSTPASDPMRRAPGSLRRAGAPRPPDRGVDTSSNLSDTRRRLPSCRRLVPRVTGMAAQTIDATAPPAVPERPERPESPARHRGTPVDGVEVVGSLSPSRAGDFMTCPLLYRYRTI